MEPIAIVGMACRFPGAPSLEEFWSLLRDGRHGIELIPESRWDRERMFDPDPEKPGKINTRHGGFIEGIDLFDHEFFRISAGEAVQMDPQQRIMLELVYEAFADANLSPTEVEGTDTAVFVGVMSNDYLRYQTADDFRRMDRYTGAGSGHCMIANRISYQFNLHGPSMAIDSACSSSLISTSAACESLWARQCSLAIAGGVNLILSPAISVFYTRNRLSASDGKCRTLSYDASGMGRGEGAGVVLLKRLSDAQSDGDAIYALIRGGAVNHNGRGNGVSAPNRWAQERLLRKAWEHAGVKPHDLDYVELHGTGTLIGDAIEATALGSVLAEDQTRDRACRVGSVKTNLGHLEGAAGVAGLIKLALCLSRGQLAPSLWYKSPNPHVAFDGLALEVQNELQVWTNHGRPRVAGISSFGLGGANAHLVLQSAPDPGPRTDVSISMEGLVLQLSARSEPALVEMVARYRGWMEDLDDEEFYSVCQTTLVRPQGHDHRATFVAGNRNEMINHLSAFSPTTPFSNVFVGRYCKLPKRKRVFIFPDSGIACFRSLAGLAGIHPCIREMLAECDRAIQEVLLGPIALRLVELLEGAVTPDARDLPFVHLAVQVALARLWRQCGLEPDAVVGIGIGQIASSVVAGAIDINEAIARTAALKRFQLSSVGSCYLRRSRPFRVDCYSSLGKNALPEIRDALQETSTGLPDLPRWQAADYFLQSLDGSQIGVVLADCVAETLIAPLDVQNFRLELARLSVAYNIQWKTFLPHPKLIRPPRYPWQRSRFWVESNQTPGAPSALPQTIDARQFSGDTLLEGANSDQAPSDAIGSAEGGQPSTTPDRVFPSLNEEKLLSLPESERRSVLASYLKEKVAETLRLSADEMEEPQTFTGLGLDSLAALKLKHRVEADLKMSVSLVKLLDGRSIGDLATDLLSAGVENNPAVANALPRPGQSGSAHGQEPNPVYELPDDLARIAPEEIDRMLGELLNRDPAGQLEPIGRSQ